MFSFWDVRYVGSHTNVFIKKLQRVLSIRASDIERERFVADSKKYERSTFLVPHDLDDWPSLVSECLSLSNLVSWKWSVILDLLDDDKRVFAQLHSESDGPILFYDKVPAGLYSLSWELRSDQVYERGRLFTNRYSW